jgi:hypothetical protein
MMNYEYIAISKYLRKIFLSSEFQQYENQKQNYWKQSYNSRNLIFGLNHLHESMLWRLVFAIIVFKKLKRK